MAVNSQFRTFHFNNNGIMKTIKTWEVQCALENKGEKQLSAESKSPPAPPDWLVKVHGFFQQ